MQLTKAGVIAVMLGGFVSAAQAATCYKTDEIEADQAVRFQAQLMVLSDSCRSPSYTNFTNRNGPTLVSYQRTLVEYFRRTNGKRADAVFDRFITSLANVIALDVGKEPVATVCSRSADFLTQAGGFGKDDFQHYVAQQAAAKRGEYPSCKN